MHTFLPYITCWINRTTFYFSPKSVLKILNLFQVIGSLDHTCVFFGFRLTTLHPRLPSSICPFCPWTDIGPLHHPWDIWGKGKIKYGVSWKIDWISQSVFKSKSSFVKAFKNHFNIFTRVLSCLEKCVEFWALKNLQNPCQIFNRTSALKSKSHFSEKSIFLFFVYFLFIFSQVTRKTKPEIKRELQD